MMKTREEMKKRGGDPIFHRHTIWRLMRKYTKRQIQDEGVIELSKYLEGKIKEIVEYSEEILAHNGTKNQRITKDCIKAVISNSINTPLPHMAGGKKEKEELNLQKEKQEIYI